MESKKVYDESVGPINEYTYDESGRLVKECTYDGENKLLFYNEYEYSEEDGVLIRKTQRDSEGKKDVDTLLSYDENGIVSREDTYYFAGSDDIQYCNVKLYDKTTGTYKETDYKHEYNENGSYIGRSVIGNHDGVGESQYNAFNRENRNRPKEKEEIGVEEPSSGNFFSNIGEKVKSAFTHSVNEIRDGINPILSEIKDVFQKLKDRQKEYRTI